MPPKIAKAIDKWYQTRDIALASNICRELYELIHEGEGDVVEAD